MTPTNTVTPEFAKWFDGQNWKTKVARESAWEAWVELDRRRADEAVALAADRTRFEAWAAQWPHRYPIAALKQGVYPDLRTQCAWEGWQRSC